MNNKQLQESDRITKEMDFIGFSVRKVNNLKLEVINNNRLGKSRPNKGGVDCLHQTCSECKGSGVKKDGSICAHYISCPCEKCSPFKL